tara:strand:+ start:144 stop:314 length:171 start_codon:yes stop_codon:yes gene_type:complete
MTTYTPQQIESDPAIKKLNMTRAQLIDHLLDEMNSFNLERYQIAKEKLKVLCPKRK